MAQRTVVIRAREGEDRELEEPVRLLQQGEVVAFPTETGTSAVSSRKSTDHQGVVYGLGASALDSTAVAKIFAAKGGR